MTNFVALDCETTGLDWLTDKLLCVGFSDGTYCLGARGVQDKLNSIKASGSILVGQNLSFDTKFLWANGIEVENEFDTMVAAYLLTERPIRLGLDSLASYYLGIASWKSDFKSGDALRDPELLKMYCLKDAEVTLKLAIVLEQKLIEEGKYEFFQKLMAARRMLTRAEYRGISFDTIANDTLIAKLTKENAEQLITLDNIGREFTSACPLTKKGAFNWNSPKQVLWLLKHLGLNTINPLTRKESADITVLEMNAAKHPLVGKIIEMRGTKKLLSTLEGYKEALRVDGALHPGVNCTNTRTGRLSSSGDLNAQQVDRSPEVRALFKARPGYKLVIGDLAQIEPRLAAHYSKDPVLCQMFTKGEDLYGTIACQILGADCAPNEVKARYPEKRQVAKVIGLSVLYGIGINKLRSTIENLGGITGFTLQGAREVIDNYFRKFVGLKDLQKNVHRAIDQKGHVIALSGRKVDVSPDEAYMTGVNSLIQSSASDYLMFKVEEFMQMIGNDVHLLMLVHDEVILEVPTHYAKVIARDLKEHMEVSTLRVPLKMEVVIGDTWAVKA